MVACGKYRQSSIESDVSCEWVWLNGIILRNGVFLVNNGVPWHVIVFSAQGLENNSSVAPKTRPFSGRKNGPKNGPKNEPFRGF
jgi:hypothetical protein